MRPANPADDPAKDGLARLKVVVPAKSQRAPDGLRHFQLADALGLRSHEPYGASKSVLPKSISGLLISEGRVVRVDAPPEVYTIRSPS